MGTSRKIKILVAPLDWGLGHASRCIPVIHSLLEYDFDVSIAGSGSALSLLTQEFPDLKCFELPSYNIRYSERMNTILSLLAQSPRVFRTVFKEKSVLKQIMDKQRFDVILSDNRFGVYNKHAYNIFMTHQTSIPLPPAFDVFSFIPNFVNRQVLKRYHEVWIPDYEDENDNLSGKLSHQNVKKNYRFIGAISRFHKVKQQEYLYDYFVILSGPEPQRSILEKKILQEARTMNKSFVIAGGKSSTVQSTYESSNIRYFPYMNSTQIVKYAALSRCVVSRAGYSTIMDLEALGKCAILIPTPGQTEQEYLAKYLANKKHYCFMEQDILSLKKVEIEKLRNEEDAFLTKKSVLDSAINDISNKFVR